MIPELTRFLVEHSREWGLPETDNWRALVHNNYHPNESGMNVFWFHGGAAYPSVVTKMWPQREPLLREFEALQHLYPRVPVPHPFHFSELFGYWALWMAGVPGQRLDVAKNRAAALRRIGEIVIPFHRSTQESNGAVRRNRYEYAVARPLDTVMRFGDSQTVREAALELLREAGAEWLNQLPVIKQHGDLWPANIVSDHNRIYIVDWEGYGVIDLPLYDLVTCSMSIARIGPGQWDQPAITEIGWLADRYASAFQLSQADLGILFPLALCNWLQLHWTEGRAEFCRNAYRLIEDYFSCVQRWGSLAAWSAQTASEPLRTGASVRSA